jgi:hypothetical protein
MPFAASITSQVNLLNFPARPCPCHFSIFYWAKILNQILLNMDIWKTGFLSLLAAAAVADGFSCLV